MRKKSSFRTNVRFVITNCSRVSWLSTIWRMIKSISCNSFWKIEILREYIKCTLIAHYVHIQYLLSHVFLRIMIGIIIPCGIYLPSKARNGNFNHIYWSVARLPFLDQFFACRLQIVPFLLPILTALPLTLFSHFWHLGK